MAKIELAPEEYEVLDNIVSSATYDDIFLKNEILEKLRNDNLILYALNTGDYEYDKDGVEPYAYSNYILPYYLLTPVQTDIKNYICFETSFDEVPRYNDILKYQQITFYIACKCSDGNIIDDEFVVARHDLIAACIIRAFNWSNDLGFQIHLVSDQARPVDNSFCGRTLVFRQTTPSTILRDGKIVNKLGIK